ncbi:uncharacterized protein I303_104912 [Kwoniella dejecticola CBS 10117]|uniref:Uncharacterized protein n=1 Tax=Kwoniella dejecticola CBS 10117 TaxID=1296121 RepID=A0A1A6A401_9TREE|nr:uncharacterized protein I303_05642 [Kwoniella dejecticola CBS 10117]OBR84783.1 hypothetical protein I303_05642 [Kwoniella dejecticola CBS 10117]
MDKYYPYHSPPEDQSRALDTQYADPTADLDVDMDDPSWWDPEHAKWQTTLTEPDLVSYPTGYDYALNTNAGESLYPARTSFGGAQTILFAANQAPTHALGQRQNSGSTADQHHENEERWNTPHEHSSIVPCESTDSAPHPGKQKSKTTRTARTSSKETSHGTFFGNIASMDPQYEESARHLLANAKWETYPKLSDFDKSILGDRILLPQADGTFHERYYLCPCPSHGKYPEPFKWKARENDFVTATGISWLKSKCMHSACCMSASEETFGETHVTEIRELQRRRTKGSYRRLIERGGKKKRYPPESSE